LGAVLVSSQRGLEASRSTAAQRHQTRRIRDPFAASTQPPGHQRTAPRVLDIKPYLPYADIIIDAGSGWLEGDALAPRDPGPQFQVLFSERAESQLAWLADRTEEDLRTLTQRALSLGPTPHAYRRIRADGDHLRLSVKDFRLRFSVQATEIHVIEFATGYRKRALQDPNAVATERTPLAVHRAFVARFGPQAAK
jgi:mRNA-degrading endonuclease RelE of RelBE toxin-antitoxin system